MICWAGNYKICLKDNPNKSPFSLFMFVQYSYVLPGNDGFYQAKCRQRGSEIIKKAAAFKV